MSLPKCWDNPRYSRQVIRGKTNQRQMLKSVPNFQAADRCHESRQLKRVKWRRRAPNYAGPKRSLTATTRIPLAFPLLRLLIANSSPSLSLALPLSFPGDLSSSSRLFSFVFYSFTLLPPFLTALRPRPSLLLESAVLDTLLRPFPNTALGLAPLLDTPRRGFSPPTPFYKRNISLYFQRGRVLDTINLSRSEPRVK